MVTSKEYTDAVNVEAKATEFSDLLDKINYASRETKKLWKEIYQNACDDRAHAFMLFTDLYGVVAGSAEAHAIHGRQISTYLERMNKSNDQLLHLSQLVENASTDDSKIDADALYDEISGKK